MAREPDPDGTDELRVFTQLLKGRKATVAAAVVLSLLSAAATLILPLQVRDLVMALAEDERPVGPLLMMAGLAVGAGLASALSSFLLARAGEGLVSEARFRIVSHILTLPLRRVRREGAGNLVARANSDSTQLRSVVDVGVAQIPSSLFLAVGTLIAMGVLDWVLLLVVLATFTVAGAGIFLCVRSIRSGVERQQNAIGAMSQQMTAAVLSLPTVKAFLAERQVASTLGHSVEDARRAAVSVARVTALVGPTMQFGQQLSIIAVMVISGARLASGALGIGEFAAFIVYLLQLVAPLTMLVSGVARMQSGLAARGRLNSVLTIAPESSGATSPVAPSPTAPAVEFDAVTYTDGGRTIIHEASFAAPARGLTAIVGPSGAGKTTLLALTERFLIPASGRISVCGRPVEKWPLHQLRSEISYVDQSFTLVEGTVRQNLQLGQDDEKAPDAELWRALEALALRGAVQALPDGLDTELGRDEDLSGGQRQRLAAARVLLRDTRIVIFDEPTSQLDSENEERLRALMRTLAAERSVIVVAHRISTVQDANLIVVVDEGHIVDRGTHEELLTRSALYQDLVHGQSLRGPARRTADTSPADPAATSSGGPVASASAAGAVAR
ncbi:ABC-type multidrug transport system fused ATPase/permease subunit [Streptomyces sp. CZ24]|uniref:ABC transporter ATP-binding protein n=1 Tax=Streptomyces albidoflavus TaxID=1886 RepID=UPI0007C64579|nr:MULTISPECIES: ABC transporter ATP-binding protein [Streptomyces]MDH6193255.1 ABC-type multidrug transport system fused ATPase/permease subunit [Streptomyces sp. CZ24]